MFSIRIFSIKWRNLFALPLLSPSGLTLPNCRFKAISASRVARSAERGLFKTSPYVAASPCFFLLSQKSAKIVSLFHRLPLGGEAPPRGGGEGRNLFSIRIFSIKWRNLFAFPLFSPSGLTLPNCRLKPNPVSMASAAAPIELFLKNRQSGGKKILVAALIFNRYFRYSGNR